MIVCDKETKLKILLEKNALEEFTKEELAEYDGTDGKPAYVAVNGVIYDVSDSPFWQGGMHFGMQSGRDLTEDFTICHLDQTVIANFKVVGKLVK